MSAQSAGERAPHSPANASGGRIPSYYGKALQPNNFPDLATLERTLLAFGRLYERIAEPIEWKFTRKDLHRVLERLDQPAPS